MEEDKLVQTTREELKRAYDNVGQKLQKLESPVYEMHKRIKLIEEEKEMYCADNKDTIEKLNTESNAIFLLNSIMIPADSDKWVIVIKDPSFTNSTFFRLMEKIMTEGTGAAAGDADPDSDRDASGAVVGIGVGVGVRVGVDEEAVAADSIVDALVGTLSSGARRVVRTVVCAQPCTFSVVYMSSRYRQDMPTDELEEQRRVKFEEVKWCALEDGTRMYNENDYVLMQGEEFDTIAAKVLGNDPQDSCQYLETKDVGKGELRDVLPITVHAMAFKIKTKDK